MRPIVPGWEFGIFAGISWRIGNEAQRAQPDQSKIVELHKGQTTAHVRIDIGNGVVITSSVTNEAVDELALKAGDSVTAIIKGSDVMVGK